MKWERIAGKECGQLGEFTAFQIFYNGIDGSKPGRRYNLVCNLPGVRLLNPYSDDEEILKGLAERTCQRWLDYANLKEGDNG
jgi:hypothetical protein